MLSEEFNYPTGESVISVVCEMDTVEGEFNIPVVGVNKGDIQFLCQQLIFQPYQSKYRKRGTGCVYQINDHLWEGKYSPRGVDGKRVSRNVYTRTREECEEQLAVMIEEMKKEIVAQKQKIQQQSQSEMVMQ